MSMQNVQPEKLPASFKKTFPSVEKLVLVTFGGKSIQLSKECLVVPVAQLHEFLMNFS